MEKSMSACAKTSGQSRRVNTKNRPNTTPIKKVDQTCKTPKCAWHAPKYTAASITPDGVDFSNLSSVGIR